MNSTEILKKLLSIPSYVDTTTNEGKLGDYIYDYLSTFPWLKLEKQYISQDRFNIIALDSADPKLLITSHMDTVQPQAGWTINPFEPIIKDGKIYGLGATDMKGGLACILYAIQKSGPTNGCSYLFYVDEEYDFLGTKKFIEDYKDKIQPKLIVSADGGNLQFGNACRGLIEITFKVTGISGHAANLNSGKNAISASISALYKLRETVDFNVAFINGGLKQGENTLGRQGNVIADYCEFTIDIRPNNPDLKAERISQIVEKEIISTGCNVETFIKHNFGAWITDVKDIQKIIQIPGGTKFVDPKDRGFIDIQLLWESFNKVPCLTFGPGEPGQAHKANEYVKISSLEKTETFFTDLISMYNTKRK